MGGRKAAPHLGQLVEDEVAWQLDEVSEVSDLDAREGLDETREVALQQSVVEGRQMRAHDGVAHELRLVRAQRRLEVLQRALLVRLGDRQHGVHVNACVRSRDPSTGMFLLSLEASLSLLSMVSENATLVSSCLAQAALHDAHAYNRTWSMSLFGENRFLLLDEPQRCLPNPCS